MYPLHNFHEICRVCTLFQDVLNFKIWMDLLKGLRSYEGFKFRGLVPAKFWVPPSGETMSGTPKIFWGARTYLRSSMTMPSLMGLEFHMPPGQPKALSHLFVYLSVCSSCFWTSEFVPPNFVGEHKRFWCCLIAEGFLVVHPCSTFSDCHQLATPLNGEVQKTAKIGGVLPPEGDRINRSRRILAR